MHHCYKQQFQYFPFIKSNLDYDVAGWICYAEKTHGSFILPYISTVRSPQQVMGSLVKDFWASQKNIPPNKAGYSSQHFMGRYRIH